LCATEYSKKVRIHTKLNGLYANIPESLLEDKKQTTVTAPTAEDVEPTEALATATGEMSLLAEIEKEAQEQKRAKAYVSSLHVDVSGKS
jgi:hypothetical protein